jgi:hypothetical protein
MASKPSEKADKPGGDMKPHRKPGRPTTYDPSNIDLVLDLGRKGYSKAEIAAELTSGLLRTARSMESRRTGVP